MKILISGLLIVFLLGCGADDNAIVIGGTWVDIKHPEHIWKLESNASGVKGFQMNADGSKGKSESWTISTKEGLIIGTSTSKEGASLAYFPKRDEILITPPGILFKRKK